MEKLYLSWLVPIFYKKHIQVIFNKQLRGFAKGVRLKMV